MKRILVGIVFSLLLLAVQANASSVVACLDNGFETRRNFVVTVLHEDRPLAGASVEVTTNANSDEVQRFSGVTDANGTVRVIGLPPGDYWLKAQLFGIFAEYHCFHVAITPSRNAKGALRYDWGDLAPATSRIAGKLIDCQSGKGESPLLNLLHCTPFPVVGAQFKLQSPTGATYTTLSDEGGNFAFDSVPDGKYVLHVEGGRTPTRGYDSADLLINLSPGAKWNTLLLTRKDPGGGSLGGTSLDLKTNSDR
jgi:Prealbumin-like fold domain